MYQINGSSIIKKKVAKFKECIARFRD